MSNYIIATASTSDLDREFLDNNNIPFISYSFILDGKDIYDDCTKQTKLDIFQAMRSGKMPSTSQITEEAYLTFFKSLVEKSDNIIYLDMSKALSNSYNNALLAKDKIKELYPNKNFYMVDTRCVTGGLALLVNKALEFKNSGASFDECIKFIEDLKMNIVHHFVVDDLKWLRKGGRLSNASAIIGTLLNIKPILYVSDEGTLIASQKVRDRKHALLEIVKNMEKDLGDPTGKEVYIFHADCYDDAMFMANKMKEHYPSLGEISLFLEGPTVGSHVGPGFISIHYVGTKRFF